MISEHSVFVFQIVAQGCPRPILGYPRRALEDPAGARGASEGVWESLGEPRTLTKVRFMFLGGNM